MATNEHRDFRPDEQNLSAQNRKRERFDSSFLKFVSKDPDLIKLIVENRKHPASVEQIRQVTNLFKTGKFDEEAYDSALEQFETPQRDASIKHIKNVLIQKYPPMKEVFAYMKEHYLCKRLREDPDAPALKTRNRANLILEIGKALGVAVNTTSADISGPDHTEEPAGDEGQYYVHRAAATGDFVGLKEVLESGANKAEKDKEGRTPLFTACSLGKVKCAEILTKAGLDVNARDSIGNTPLHYAAAYGEKACVALLLKHDALVTLRNEKGLTPVDIAKITGHRGELMKLLEARMPRTTEK